MSKKTYEAIGNIHIPELKCSISKGVRVYVNEEDQTVEVNGRTIPFSADFQIIIRHGILKELSAEEAKTPEKVEEPKVLFSAKKQKMKVEEKEDSTIPLSSLRSGRVIEEESSDPEPGKGVVVKESDPEDLGEEVKIVRGMQVVEETSTPIQTIPLKSSEVSENEANDAEKPSPVENTPAQSSVSKASSTKAKPKAKTTSSSVRSSAKKKSASKPTKESDKQKAEKAAALKVARVKSATEAEKKTETKGE